MIAEATAGNRPAGIIAACNLHGCTRLFNAEPETSTLSNLYEVETGETRTRKSDFEPPLKCGERDFTFRHPAISL